MAEGEEEYATLMTVHTVEGLDADAALRIIGRLTDLSLDCGGIDGIRRAISLGQELQGRELSPSEQSTLHYFLANAYANLSRISRTDGDVWNWEQDHTEKEIMHLRLSLQGRGFAQVPEVRRCQILTNLGNAFSFVGRFVEAIEYWDRALSIVPSFPMALGNRGYGLIHYANVLYDHGHALVFLKRAYHDLDLALQSAGLEDHAQAVFRRARQRVESAIPGELERDIDLLGYGLGDTEEEVAYRRWCLENRLFLNPLNDLGPFPVAARDVLTTPDIVVGIDEGPYYPGFFNQLKQEFVSARYLSFDGMTSRDVHFSDKGVILYDTLDYPSYCLAVEKVKASFRIAYSLFDKIAFFLNHYLRLRIPGDRVSFRRIWYTKGEQSKGLRPEFCEYKNWPLRGLFWLSKDLYEEQFQESTEPSAHVFSEVRNHLEHKYLKLHELWPGPSAQHSELMRGLCDSLAFSMGRQNFQVMTMTLLKMARAALIYLSLAIYVEEQLRQPQGYSKRVVPMLLDVYDDEWKR